VFVKVKYIEEIPAQANEAIHQLDELTGNIILAVDLGILINRYRILCDESLPLNEGRNYLRKTLNELLHKLGSNSRWIFCWRKDFPSTARSRLTYSRLIKDGWSVYGKNNIWIGIKPVNNIEKLPDDYEWQHGGVILLSGDNLDSFLSYSDITNPTLEDLSLAGKIRPSAQFIKLLHDTNTSCVYFYFDERGRPEIIVLTNTVLKLSE